MGLSSKNSITRLVSLIDCDRPYHAERRMWMHSWSKSISSHWSPSTSPARIPVIVNVLADYQKEWKPNPEGFLFVTRDGRPPSSNKVVEYQLWPILDALGIPRCGLHAFRHSVASFIVDAGYSIEVAQQQLRHSNAKTTLGYTHFRGGLTEEAMANVSASLKLDVVGRKKDGGQYLQ